MLIYKVISKVTSLCIMWLLFNYTYLNLHLSSIDRAYNHPSWNDLKSFQYIRLRIVQFPLLVKIGVSCLGGPTTTLTLNINPQNIAAIYIQGLIRCQVVIVSCGVEVCSFSGNLFINSFEKLYEITFGYHEWYFLSRYFFNSSSSSFIVVLLSLLDTFLLKKV